MIKTATASVKGSSDSGKPLVLYVEDEEDNWKVTELRLHSRYSLLRAADDVEACRMIRSHGGVLYAILMDIQLKGSKLDGIELCRVFKGHPVDKPLPSYAQGCPRVAAPIFFVTAYGMRYSEEELKKAGGTALLTKPVDFVRLTLALASANAQGAVTALNR